MTNKKSRIIKVAGPFDDIFNTLLYTEGDFGNGKTKELDINLLNLKTKTAHTPCLLVLFYR